MNITSTIALTLSLFCLTAASAEVAIRPPFWGCHIAGEQGQLRLLDGVRGAVAATRLGSGVVAVACNESRILHHTGRHLVLDQNGRRELYPLEGRFLLALDGQFAVAVEPLTGFLLQFSNGEWLPASFQPLAGVRAIRLDEGRLSVLAHGGIEEWDLATGALIASESIDVPNGPAALLSNHTVLVASDGMWLHCTPSACTELAPAPLTTLALTPLSGGWWAASTSSGLPVAVRIHRGAMESFYLPGEPFE